MPPKKVPAKKQSEILEEEAKKMESIMSMLRGQIAEEKAKVQPKSNGSRWAAAAEGPMGKFDSHGKLARQILSKKPPKSKGGDSQSPARPPPRSQSERADNSSAGTGRNTSTTSSSSLSSKYRPPPPKGKKGNVEIVVEPQGGKLWGTYMADNSTQPEEGSGGALWGNKTTDSSVQPDGPSTGGSLWGPHPDEKEDSKSFQEELKRIRSSSRNSTSASTTTSTTTTSTESDIKKNDDQDLPPIGAGGALWGPPPDEQLEQQKFQREIARFRGEPVPPPVESKAENESACVGGNIIQKKAINPTGFTYFDRLVTKDILSGEPVIQQPKSK